MKIMISDASGHSAGFDLESLRAAGAAQGKSLEGMIKAFEQALLEEPDLIRFMYNKLLEFRTREMLNQRLLIALRRRKYNLLQGDLQIADDRASRTQ